MSRELAKASPIKAEITGYMPVMLKALPDDEETRNRFKQAALAIASSGALETCTPRSIVKCVYECARLNLIPDPIMQLIAIVPFKGVATLIPMYKGLLTLARRAAPQLYIDVGSVHEHDDFDLIEGTETKLTIRKRWYLRGFENPGKLLLTYCVSAMPGQARRTVVVSRQESELVKSKSRAGNKPGSPWVEHFEAMAQKTALRKAAKLWTLSPTEKAAMQLHEALALDEADSEDLPAPTMEIVDDIIDNAASQSQPAEGEQSIGRLQSQAAASRNQAAKPVQQKREPESIESLRSKLSVATQACIKAYGVDPDSPLAMEAFARFYTGTFSTDDALAAMQSADRFKLQEWEIMASSLAIEKIKSILDPFFIAVPVELEKQGTGFQKDMQEAHAAVKEPVPTYQSLVDVWVSARKCSEAQAKRGVDKLVDTMFGKEWVDIDADEARMVKNRMGIRTFDYSKFDQ